MNGWEEMALQIKDEAIIRAYVGGVGQILLGAVVLAIGVVLHRTAKDEQEPVGHVLGGILDLFALLLFVAGTMDILMPLSAAARMLT